MDYWKQIFRRAFAETKKSIGSLFVKLAPAILVPLLLWREFGMGSVTSLAGIVPIAICLLEAYGIVFAALYGWKVIAAIPILLHDRDATIAELNPLDMPAFRVVIEQMNVSASNYE